MQQMYHSPLKEGLWSGRGLLAIIPGSMDDTREAIQRELEKEMIREEILAEEIARKRVLEAQVRREMAMHHGGGFPSSLKLKPPGMPPVQPFGGGGSHAVPFQRFPSTSGDGKNKVVDLGKLNDSANREPPPLPAAASSSQLKHCTGVIGLGVRPKMSVKKQPSLIKNSDESGFPYWCGVCGVGAASETNMNQHNEGKKHMKNLEKGSHGNLGVRKRSSGMKSKKTKRKQKSQKAPRHWFF